MKIMTWNFSFENPDPKGAIGEMLKTNCDVYCLQEISERVKQNIEELTRNDYQMHSVLSVVGTSKPTHPSLYEVILVKKSIQILNTSKISIRTESINTDVSFILRQIFGKLLKKGTFFEYRCEDAAIVDIESEGKQYRIINLHLMFWAIPPVRISQFHRVLEHLDKDKVNIICGDFNVVEKLNNNLSAKFLSLGLGSTATFNWKKYREYYYKGDEQKEEREQFEILFNRANLENIFRGKITTSGDYAKILPCQFDHILLPKYLAKSQKMLDGKKLGSDHNPLFVELN